MHEEFIKFWFGALMSVREKKPLDERGLQKFFERHTPELIIWGSPPMLRAYGEFRSAGNDPDRSDPRRPLFVFESLLLAIREDLGHSNDGLEQGDLLRLFITDFDQYFKRADT